MIQYTRHDISLTAAKTAKKFKCVPYSSIISLYPEYLMRKSLKKLNKIKGMLEDKVFIRSPNFLFIVLSVKLSTACLASGETAPENAMKAPTPASMILNPNSVVLAPLLGNNGKSTHKMQTVTLSISVANNDDNKPLGSNAFDTFLSDIKRSNGSPQMSNLNKSVHVTSASPIIK